MFRIQQIEMVHWDFWQRVQVPLDAQIVTIIGPNGSGKTTLLDALRTMLALDCSGRRDYKRYVRNNKSPFAWLRGVVANPRTSGLFPYPFWPMQTEQVTLFCRIKKQGGDWMRQYAIAEGDVALDEDTDGKVEWLGVQEYRRRLEQAGLTPAIAKVLALEQGDTDKLCEYSPKALLDLVFQVFGDKAVLDHYSEAKEEQRKVEAELEELNRGLTALEHEVLTAEQRADKFLEWRRLSDDLVKLESEVLPRVRLGNQEKDLGEKWHEYRTPWAAIRSAGDQVGAIKDEQAELTERLRTARQAVEQAESTERAAIEQFSRLNSETERHRSLLNERERLKLRAREHPGAEATAEEAAKIKRSITQLDRELSELHIRREDLATTQAALAQTGQLPLPRDVLEFRRALDGDGIGHDLLLDVVDVSDPKWQAAVEGMLRAHRFVVLLKRPGDRLRARELGQRLRYRHFIVDERGAPAPARKGTLAEVVRFTADVPDWVADSLNRVSRVATVQEGERVSGDWITPDGYFKERRGSRHIGVEARDFHFGVGVKKAREQAVTRELSDVNRQLVEKETERGRLQQDLAPLMQMLEGVTAAQLLTARAAEFDTAEAAIAGAAEKVAEAGQALATAQQVTQLERDAWRELDKQLDRLVAQLGQAETLWLDARRLLAVRRGSVREQISDLRRTRHGMPADWLKPEARAELAERYPDVATATAQLRYERERLDTGLARGEWITDDTVLLRRDKLRQLFNERQSQMNAISIQLVRAKDLTEDARAAYINKLKSTVRNYGRNIKRLGGLAGIEVEADTPPLENDDLVLAQAGLTVKFNFDQKGMMGLNDGEASGGQQVMKSLILLIGLMMNEDRPSGFVFIDEPFAHLDIFNIDRVGAFLKATEAQYLITSPNTHNVNIFEPSELTLTTRKKRPGEGWAPPLLQTRRKMEVGRRA